MTGGEKPFSLPVPIHSTKEISMPSRSRSRDDGTGFEALIVGALIFGAILLAFVLFKGALAVVRVHRQADVSSRRILLSALAGLVAALCLAGIVAASAPRAAETIAIIAVALWVAVVTLVGRQVLTTRDAAGFIHADLRPWRMR
jgi:CDP-diglyceride synthetase